jgi:hypothetical protein
MKKTLKILILIFLVLFGQKVFASGNGINVGEIVEEIIDFVIYIAIAGAGVIMMIGGYFMITSAGNPQDFERGKKTLIYGAIGLILVAIARELAEEIMKLLK